MSHIADNLITVRGRIASACSACGRQPGQVELLAVSKGQDTAAIEQAAAAGQIQFGENYLQEALGKIQATAGAGLRWHFIGPIQSNKTQDIAEHFDWAHAVDRLKIAQRLSSQRPPDLAPLNICVQVNISDEPSKSGCAGEDALDLCSSIAALPGLSLRGLMAIPAPVSKPTDARRPYQLLRELFENIRLSLPQIATQFDTISAGMSDDLEAAIAEGATLVRIGASIFGPRSRKPA